MSDIYQHVAVFRWKPGADTAAIAVVGAELRALANIVPGLISYACGEDLHMRSSNDDFAISAAFESEEALRNYLGHPEHLRIVRDHAALVADKHGVQFIGQSPL